MVPVHAFTTAMPANLVIGQTDFNGNLPLTSQTGLNQPSHLVFDASGNLWVADSLNNRVLMFKPPFRNGTAASIVIGQPDFASNGANGGGDLPDKDLLSGPMGLAFDPSGNLWVADQQNNRVLRFSPPFSSRMDANLVIGQADFTSSYTPPSPTASSLAFPRALAFDVYGNLWVDDWWNNRLLKFPTPQTTHMAATVVIGQSDFTHKSYGSGTTGLTSPMGLAFDLTAGTLWVADYGNNRVLRFPSPQITHMAANLVIGQPDFTHTGSATTQSGLVDPTDLLLDWDGDLWVADYYSYRVLMYKSPSTLGLGWVNGMEASEVIGQPDFTTASPASGTSGLNLPWSLAVDLSGNLWIADSGNNRVLRFAGSSGLMESLLKLQAGWNLISLPTVPPNTLTQTVLKALIQLDDLVIVWAKGSSGWLYFDPGPPIFGRLQLMNTGQAYLLRVREPVNITLVGYVISPFTGPPAYSLSAGWNMLGFSPMPVLENETVGQYLLSINGTYDQNRVWVYDSLNQLWVRAGSSTWLVPGEGMWIYMKTAATLNPQ